MSLKLPSALKSLANPLAASVMLLAIVAARAALKGFGIGGAELLYALIPGPIAILAAGGGLLLVLAASAVTVLADTFLVCIVTGESLAVGAASLIGPIEKLLLICACGAALTAVAAYFRSRCNQESLLAEDSLKRLYLQRKENDSALHDAESHVVRCMQDVDRYSSLVLLLEEAAEKIYSTLDTQSLLDTFTLVLRKCIGAETGSIYFLDEHGRTFVLHSSFGYGPGKPFDQPAMVPANDPLLGYVAMSRRAIGLYDGAPPDPQVRRVAPQSAVHVVMSAALLEQDKATGIVNIHTFRDDSRQDFCRDTALLSMLSNITSIALTNARLFSRIQDMADRDPLTKLFNRRYFYERLGAELTRSRAENSPACLLLFDVDHFKAVNDNHGHQAGDAVLIGFANTCKKIVRECDVLARYGGEEFVFLLPNMAAEEGRQVAERVRRTIAAAKFEFEGSVIRVTTSCGVAGFPEHAADVGALTQAADLALYEAKASGRNTVAVAQSAGSRTVAEAGDVETHTAGGQP